MSASHRSTVSLSDPDIRGRLTPAESIAVVREAALGAHRGTFTTPPRVYEGGPDSGPVQSVGATSGWYGYVSSDAGSPAGADSVVMLHDRASGALRAICVGSELAHLCESGFLGLAADVLAAPDAAVLAVIGDGRSVADTIRAVAAVRPLAEVRISAPLAENADDSDLVESFAVPIIRASSIAEAAIDASIVVMLHGSAADLDPALLSAGSTVLVVGDPERAGEDFPVGLIGALDVLTTDSPSQLAAYDLAPELAALVADIVSLGAITDGSPARRRPADRVGLLAVGLPAAQLLLLDHLVDT